MMLTQKESTFLRDLKGQEQVCAQKYTRYADTCCDPQLKTLFSTLAGHERKHYDTLTQMESGVAPSMQGGCTPLPEEFTASACAAEQKAQDEYLCKDALSMEKFVSSDYNTAVFEFRDKAMRDVLNHIQGEEQEHGKALYDYMAANNMYSA